MVFQLPIVGPSTYGEVVANGIQRLNVGNTTADVAKFTFKMNAPPKMPTVYFVNESGGTFNEIVHVGPAAVFRPLSGALIGVKQPDGRKAFNEEPFATVKGEMIRQVEQCEPGTSTAKALENWALFEGFFNTPKKESFSFMNCAAGRIIVPTPDAARLELLLQAASYDNSLSFPGVVLVPQTTPLPPIAERVKNTPSDKSVHDNGPDTAPLRQDSRICERTSAFPVVLQRITTKKGVTVDSETYPIDATLSMLQTKYGKVIEALFGDMKKLHIGPSALESLVYSAPFLSALLKEVPEADLKLLAKFFYTIKDGVVHSMVEPTVLGPDNKPLSLRVLWDLERKCRPDLTPLVAFTMSPSCWKSREKREDSASIGYNFGTIMVLGLVPAVAISKTVEPEASKVPIDLATRMAARFATGVLALPAAGNMDVGDDDDDDTTVANAAAAAEAAAEAAAAQLAAAEAAAKAEAQFAEAEAASAAASAQTSGEAAPARKRPAAGDAEGHVPKKKK